MKTWIFALTLSLASFANVQASELSVTLENGATVSLAEDACRDPVTGRLGPCLLAIAESNVDQDACYNPATGKLEPCLSAARAGDQAPACYDPVTKRWEPCW
jgi:hypothetical protein